MIRRLVQHRGRAGAGLSYTGGGLLTVASISGILK